MGRYAELVLLSQRIIQFLLIRPFRKNHKVCGGGMIAVICSGTAHVQYAVPHAAVTAADQHGNSLHGMKRPLPAACDRSRISGKKGPSVRPESRLHRTLHRADSHTVSGMDDVKFNVLKLPQRVDGLCCLLPVHSEDPAFISCLFSKDNIPDEKISNFQFFHNIAPLLSLLH